MAMPKCKSIRGFNLKKCVISVIVIALNDWSLRPSWTLDNVKKKFPYSTTKNVRLTREEMEKSYLLEKVADGGLKHREAEPSQENGNRNYLRGVREGRRREVIFEGIKSGESF
ncbi:hypothetical protein DAPPUDRAFT_117901 [Daphnia pulex]|uniref:Uncharacterized protein n=1 Tax=Daphnia pulex TaxID=6669 RepID=E9HU40_DAPPU|nr:hypothetical protein DAPPUDRAFT_117901 [Daphnia pulex]|eukprot:EFX64743.1 hypothetical protein DAPPUDRAFT_117901 [Daphnia pulex]